MRTYVFVSVNVCVSCECVCVYVCVCAHMTLKLAICVLVVFDSIHLLFYPSIMNTEFPPSLTEEKFLAKLKVNKLNIIHMIVQADCGIADINFLALSHHPLCV